MQSCLKCRVTIQGRKKCCPLCAGALQGKGSREPFPCLDYVRKNGLLMRLIAFFLISATVICYAINLLIPTDTMWAGFVALGCGCALITSFVGISVRGNILKCIVQLELICLPLGVLWDYITGWRDWSLNYYYPTVSVLVSITIFILAGILKLEPSKYVMSLTVSSVVGLIPIIFLALGWAELEYPSIICTAVSLLFICGILLFYWRNLKSEAGKKFHL